VNFSKKIDFEMFTCLPVLVLCLLTTVSVNGNDPQPMLYGLPEREASGLSIGLDWSTLDDNLPALKSIVASFQKLVDEVSKSDMGAEKSGTASGLHASIGIGHRLWRTFSAGTSFSAEIPSPLFHEFKTLKSVDGRYTMPATEGADLFIHARAPQRDVLYHLQEQFLSAVEHQAGVALASVQSTNGWHDYYESGNNRDLTGFVDGTVNCPRAQIGANCLLAPAAPDLDFLANSTVLLAQRWVHNLRAFDALPVPAQERVFGRTKADSKILNPVPANAHIHRTNQFTLNYFIERQAIAFGQPGGPRGLLFLAYANAAQQFDKMLDSMYGYSPIPALPANITDAMLDFTQPTNTAYFLVPSIQLLEQLSQ
jgi:porphyrinogen peroxidase